MNPLPRSLRVSSSRSPPRAAAAPALAADPVFPVNSRVGLVPPAGFTPSTKFSASRTRGQRRNPAGRAAGRGLRGVEKGFTDEALKARGMTVQAARADHRQGRQGILRRRPAGVRRREALRVRDDREHGGHHVARIGADDRGVARDNHRCGRARHVQDAGGPQGRPESERLAVLPYKIGDLGELPRRATAPRGHRDPDRRAERRGHGGRAAVHADRVAPGEAPKPEDRDKFARSLFGTIPGIKDIKVTRAEPLRIGQAQGYEIVADAKDAIRHRGHDGAVAALRQSGYLQIFAIVRKTTWNDVFPRLRAIRDSIEPR